MRYDSSVEIKINEIATIESNNNALIESSWDSLSKETQSAYKSDLDKFFSFINKNPEHVTPEDIIGYIRYMRERNLKNATINRRISSVSKMFTVLMQAGKIQRNPVSLVRSMTRTNYKTQKSVKSPLKIAQVKKALNEKGKSIPQKRIIALIKFLGTTGCRISEATGVKHSDITDYTKGVKKIRIFGKGSKERYVYAEEKFLKHIDDLHGCGKYLFCSKKDTRLSRTYMWLLITRHFNREIGQHVHPHMLRHFFATHKINVEGKDIKSVSKFLGHSSTSITLDMYVDTELSHEDAGIDL